VTAASKQLTQQGTDDFVDVVVKRLRETAAGVQGNRLPTGTYSYVLETAD
jgi:hypothetical protein